MQATSAPVSLDLPAIQALWPPPDMAAVDALIRRRLGSEVVLGQPGRRTHRRRRRQAPAPDAAAAGGPRPRPPAARDAHQLAAVVEFIHTATLLHDDVVDESDLRRGRKTANALFGNAAERAGRRFPLLAQLPADGGTGADAEVMRILADTTNAIAEGEVLQLLHIRNPDTDEPAYLKVIERKTAVLFAAATRIGAQLAGADEAAVQQQAPRLRHGAGLRLPDRRRRAGLQRGRRRAGQASGRRSGRRQGDIAADPRDPAFRCGGHPRRACGSIVQRTAISKRCRRCWRRSKRPAGWSTAARRAEAYADVGRTRRWRGWTTTMPWPRCAGWRGTPCGRDR